MPLAQVEDTQVENGRPDRRPRSRSQAGRPLVPMGLPVRTPHPHDISNRIERPTGLMTNELKRFTDAYAAMTVAVYEPILFVGSPRRRCGPSPIPLPSA